LGVSGPDALSIQSHFGQWTQSTGTLVLQLSAPMRATNPFKFSFNLQNSILSQAPVIPTIEVNGAVTVPAARFCSSVLGVNHSAALLLEASIVESTCTPCQSNLFSLTLRPNVDLPNGTFITVSNLTGGLTPAGWLDLAGSHRLNFTLGRAAWEPSHGSVTLEVGLPISRNDTIEVSFALHNGPKPQTPRIPTLQFQTPDYDVTTQGPLRVYHMTGDVLSFSGVKNESVMSTPSWLASGWKTEETWQTSDVAWLEGASGSCCAGACCQDRTCCSCSTLKASGLDSFRQTGVYFLGSPCEVYCDMTTDGGGWTLISTHTNNDTSHWFIYPTNETAELQNIWSQIPNNWENSRNRFGTADPSVHADFKSWAFFQEAGDNRGAGDQLMITSSSPTKNGDAVEPILFTDGTCLGQSPLSMKLAQLSWNCSTTSANDTIVRIEHFFSEMDGGTIDSPKSPVASCANECPIAWSRTSLQESSILNGRTQRYLFLKTGVADAIAGSLHPSSTTDSISLFNESTNETTIPGVNDQVYISTTLRDSGAKQSGLGTYCNPAWSSDCGNMDVGGNKTGDWRYSLWVRRDNRWEGQCNAPLRRVGLECECCNCEPGYSHNGARCVQCPRGRYKATRSEEPCLVCPGTDNLPEGQTTCPNSLEFFVFTNTAPARYEGLDLLISVQWEESSEWTPFYRIAAPSGGLNNVTSRKNFEDQAYVGTPAAIRYGIDARNNRDYWEPGIIAVRPNGGKWFETNSTLCGVDVSCGEAPCPVANATLPAPLATGYYNPPCTNASRVSMSIRVWPE